jgi:hypothetical protein
LAALTASVPANAQPVPHHRAVHSQFTAKVDPPAAATASHGRGAPTVEIFSRNAEDCAKSICVGL